jgi:hypothetical protein
MASREGPQGAAGSALAEVTAYWTALSDRAGGVPARAAVDPRGIAGALGATFLAERVAPGVARFRLAGTGVSAVMGMEVHGMPLLTLFTPDTRREAAEAFERVFASPATAILRLEAERGFARPALSGRLGLFPLTGRQGAVDMALGVLALDGPVGRAPRRFAVASAAVAALPGRGASLAEHRFPGMPDHLPETAPGLAEAPADFTPAAGHGTAPALGAGRHLRLVWSGPRR